MVRFLGFSSSKMSFHGGFKGERVLGEREKESYGNGRRWVFLFFFLHFMCIYAKFDLVKLVN